MSEDQRIEWRALLTDAFAVSGMSERAVSELAGLNRGSLSGVLGGRTVPRAATIDALRRAFDLSADLEEARREVADRRAKPGVTPSLYWRPEPGDPERENPVAWGHMEDRFAEVDERIARLEQAVINLANAVDRTDLGAQDAYVQRIRRQQEAAKEARLHALAETSPDVQPSIDDRQPRDRKRDSLVNLRRETTLLSLVRHYLDVADQDATDAARLLAQVGAKGANVDTEIWEGALSELHNIARDSALRPAAHEEEHDIEAEQGHDEHP